MTSALLDLAGNGLAENNFGDTRSGGLAGPMGLFIILLMGIATILLIRNMSARIRRLPAQFPDQSRRDAEGPGQAPANPVADPASSEPAGSHAAESESADRVADPREKPYGA